MPTPFKEYLSEDFLSLFADKLKQHLAQFDKESFMADVFTQDYENFELKERTRHISTQLNHHLTQDYSKDIDVLIKSMHAIVESGVIKYGIELLFIPGYVEVFGLTFPEISRKSMEKISPVISCEFAVRPFLKKYKQWMQDVMYVWASSEDHHLRRLSCEGCRPRLPWAMALPDFKNNPGPILPILEQLKNDPSEYVRRSVANNLNDISKDNPQITYSICKAWKGQTKNTDALIKHAMRTLLKNNYTGSMQLFGYAKATSIKAGDLEILTPKIKTGDRLIFQFKVNNQMAKTAKVRLEYAIHFLLSNGTNARKIFKISERNLEAGEKISIKKEHNFRTITTRKYYAGKHYVSIVVNGKEKDIQSFLLET